MQKREDHFYGRKDGEINFWGVFILGFGRPFNKSEIEFKYLIQLSNKKSLGTANLLVFF
jgi:hypothetical protein